MEDFYCPEELTDQTGTLAQRQVRRRKKSRGALRFLRSVALLWLAAMGCILLGLGWSILSSWQAPEALAALFPFLRPEASMDRGWNLVLVNEDYRVPEDYVQELVTLANGQQVDRRVYPDLQQMFDDMRAQGVYPIVASGYRTRERQQELLEERVQEYRSQGHSRWEARAMALEWVARPGTSEHELGIAVDINQEGTRSTAAQVYAWLRDNAHRYGFIRRYPPEKSHITGISNEPWHYRYVGREAAERIYAQDITLEEYLGLA